jgi:hypothetical protein
MHGHVPNRCPSCRQLLLNQRAGVHLSALKTHLFDVIERAGPDGITVEDLNAICFGGDSTAVNIRTHIGQINDALAGTDIRIRGDNPRGFYRITHTKGGRM